MSGEKCFAETVTEMSRHTRGPEILRGLGAYLDRIGFHAAYKYLASANFYSVTPAVLSSGNADFTRLSARFGGDIPPLIWLLSAGIPCRPESLDADERRLAEDLAGLRLAREEDGELHPGPLQLISAFGRYILVDARIHFPERAKGRLHDIYIGCDSLLLMYYVDDIPGRVRTAIDLCSGSGVVALGLAKFADRVIASDIAPVALALIGMNTLLNRAEDRLIIRRERLEETLANREAFDLITCNPPFVAFPPGFGGPLYAIGPDADGQGYLRRLVERAPEKLTPDGQALFVSHLPGSEKEPFFFDELRQATQKHGFFVEAFVDARMRTDGQARAMAGLLRIGSPDQPLDVLRREMDRFYREDLGCSHFYLSVIRLRRSGRPEVRVLNRFREG